MSGGPVAVFKKYTTGSVGIWEKIRQILTLVPNRSSGNPLVKYFRVPSPTDTEIKANYKDPITIPSGDIAKNNYFDRDFRRSFPKTSKIDQVKLGGLLTLGSLANPRISIGNKGIKELELYEKDKALLNTTLVKVSGNDKIINGEILGPQGEPVVAPNLNKFKWKILSENEHGMYDETYPVRIFTEAKN
ncbi:hypothetical protein PACTADRAFT_74710 [Pachysolen tannophilus NRRL Y-2460]|uniref:Uncharacterized protein n=1 Tax=Pachysolen tannophilus NRRL Y-2460 TaxID=669874 RepID=A0A1E4TZI5_PACTA|nr:hypothetical protein PACTADRAFT_74710 [Pachysolen tannophilus NRRL Y-2460]